MKPIDVVALLYVPTLKVGYTFAFFLFVILKILIYDNYMYPYIAGFL